MSEARRFNLLLLWDNGRRVLRLHVPRWITAAALVLAALPVFTLGAIYGDYVALRRQIDQVQAVRHQVRVLDDIRLRIDDPGDQRHAVRQLDVAPDAPFVLVARVRRLDVQRAAA